MFYFGWEFPFLDALQHMHSPILDQIMVGITTLGDEGIIWIITGIVLLFFKKTRKCGAAVLLALLFSLFVGNIALKNIIARERPCWIRPDVSLLINCPSDFSFPSGHSQASFAAAFAIFTNHKKGGTFALILAGLIAFSRMYLYVHFPTDVIAGTIIGCGLGWLANYVIEKIISTYKSHK